MNFVLERPGRVIDRLDLFILRVFNIHGLPHKLYAGPGLGLVQGCDGVNRAIAWRKCSRLSAWIAVVVFGHDKFLDKDIGIRWSGVG